MVKAMGCRQTLDIGLTAGMTATFAARFWTFERSKKAKDFLLLYSTTTRELATRLESRVPNIRNVFCVIVHRIIGNKHHHRRTKQESGGK
jgi:hypothetical protein